MAAGTDRAASTGKKSDICLSLAEMFARQLRGEMEERHICSGAGENEDKKRVALGGNDLLKMQVMASTVNSGIN